GQLTHVVYPAGFAVTYQRNAAGQVSDIGILQGQQPSAFATGLTYNPFGPLKSLTWANGLTLSRTYDQDYRLTQQSVGPWQANYGYDANSNIESLQSGLFGDLFYSYDELDRLTQEEQANLRQQYTYDAVGNRTSKAVTHLGSTPTSTTTTLGYATNSNRLTQIGSQAVTSDAAGNLTKDRASRELQYDAQGRLARVKIGNDIVAEYRYNALGQRTHKITSIAVVTFLYGPDGQLLGETRYNSAGTKLSSQYYLWLDSMPIGGQALSYSPNGSVSNRTTFYLHADHLNSPRLATNQAGQEIWRWKSDAFGEGAASVVQGSGIDAINLRFPGQYYDFESGLHYNYFRDYDPQTGRYVESDPIGLAGGLNTFGYATGNPIKYADFLGLTPNTPYDTFARARSEMLEEIRLKGIETGNEWTSYIYKIKDNGCVKYAYTELSTNEHPNLVIPQEPLPGKPPLEHGHNHPGNSDISDQDILISKELNVSVSKIGHDGRVQVYDPKINWIMTPRHPVTE
ncbi:RHS repeat protein, partial [Salmonella enterica subsp. enterica]|nr:RHS repeat protein [Salmonella enterica subsp. enterica serovar Javiana]